MKNEIVLSIWANLKLIILFSKMLKFSKKSGKSIIKENKEFDEIFEDISIVKMKISKLINYLTNMCQSCQGKLLQYKMTNLLKCSHTIQ